MRSTAYTEAHFDAKAARYQNALRVAPHARVFELLPFLLFLNDRLATAPHLATAADLLCGSGFLTSAIATHFKRLVGLDISNGMLRHFPSGPTLSCRKATLDEHSVVLGQEIRPDAIVALAGLHHVYEISNGDIDREASDSLHRRVMLNWAMSLPENGVMVVADVTDPARYAGYSSATTMLRQRHSALTECFALSRESARSHGCSEVVPPYPRTLQEYVSAVANLSRNLTACPGEWFRNVVAEHGVFGHTDHFLRPSEIVDGLISRGFVADYYELPTPWVFESEAQFLAFFYDKFAFGPPVSSLADIPAATKRFIRRSAGQYLGVGELSDGAILIGWRLGYYVVSRAS